MNLEEAKARISELEAEIARLNKKPSLTAYQKLQEATAKKVEEAFKNVIFPECGLNSRSRATKLAKRKLVDDIKWDLKIRYIPHITDEQLPLVMEYIAKYDVFSSNADMFEVESAAN